jgi:hypothetical protein
MPSPAISRSRWSTFRRTETFPGALPRTPFLSPSTGVRSVFSAPLRGFVLPGGCAASRRWLAPARVAPRLLRLRPGSTLGSHAQAGRRAGLEAQPERPLQACGAIKKPHAVKDKSLTMHLQGTTRPPRSGKGEESGGGGGNRTPVRKTWAAGVSVRSLRFDLVALAGCRLPTLATSPCDLDRHRRARRRSSLLWRRRDQVRRRGPAITTWLRLSSQC